MLHAKKKTGLVFFPAFDWSISPTHPEREERLLYTQDQVFEEGLLDAQLFMVHVVDNHFADIIHFLTTGC